MTKFEKNPISLKRTKLATGIPPIPSSLNTEFDDVANIPTKKKKR